MKTLKRFNNTNVL